MRYGLTYCSRWRGAAFLSLVNAVGLIACGGSKGTPDGGPMARDRGQSDFVSAPAGGQSGSGNAGAPTAASDSAAGGAGASHSQTPREAFASNTSPQPMRTVEETDIYRVD